MAISSLKTLSLLIGLFFIYFLQGIFYSSGGIISISCLIGIIVIEGFHSLQLFLQGTRNTSIMLIHALFFILLITFLVSPSVVWGNVYEAIGEISTQSQFKESACFILMFPTIYLICRDKIIPQKYFLIFGICLFILSILQFFHYQDLIQIKLNTDRDITNNSAYWFVCLLPFLPLILQKRPIIATILFLLATIFIMSGAKRGAIICLGVSIVYSLYFYLKYTSISFRQIIILTLSLSGIIFFILYLYSINEYLQMRIETNNNIGTREIAYRTLFMHWQTDDNLFTSLLGNGTAQTVALWGNFAHNDWLELLIDNGVLGVGLYAGILVSLFLQIYRSQLPFHERWAAYLCFIIWGLKSTFSMGYADMRSALLPGLLGLLLACKIPNGEDSASIQ